MSDELTALADNLDRIGSSSFFTETRKVLSDAASALRRIAAAGEHKPQPGWDRGELLDCAQWLENGASLAVSAASKEQGELAARALREFADINASAEARLREALERAIPWLMHYPEGAAWNAAKQAKEALSPDPHAGDCEKQGGTTKSIPVQDAEPANVAGRTGGAHPPTGANPSDRPADVTVDELAHWLLHNLSLDAHPLEDARAILDAFTVGRR